MTLSRVWKWWEAKIRLLSDFRSEHNVSNRVSSAKGIQGVGGGV